MDVNSRDQLVDILRGFAILGVVSVHTGHIFLGSDSGAGALLIEAGKYGVEVFFFISGFLMTKIYGLKNDKLDPKYLTKRVVRIWPLWTVFLILNLIMISLKVPNSPFSDSTFANSNDNGVALRFFLGVAFLLFLNPSYWNSVVPGGWSIQAEVGHYSLFALFRRTGLGGLLILSTSLNFVTFLILRSTPRARAPEYQDLNYFLGSWLRLSLYSTFSFFVLGIAFYHFLESQKFGQLRLICDARYICLGLLFLGFLFLTPCPFGKSWQAMLCLVFQVFLAYALIRIKPISRYLKVVGEYSYFTYFSHFGVLNCLIFCENRFELHPRGFLAYLGAYLFVIALCTYIGKYSMRYFERPLMRKFS